jgi:hypothetical protein
MSYSSFASCFGRGIPQAAVPVWFVPHDGYLRRNQHGGKAGMALAKLLTNGINPSRHSSTSSSKRTTLRSSVNSPSRVNHCPTMSTGNSTPISSASSTSTSTSTSVAIACIQEQNVLDRILAHLREKEQNIPLPPLLLPRAWCHPPAHRQARCPFSRGRVRSSRTRFFIDQAAVTPLNNRWV